MTTTTRPLWAGTLAERGASAILPTYARYPLELVSGHGARVVDSSGRTYLDFVAGIAVNVLGHRHPAVVRSIREAADGLLHVSNLYWTEPMVRLAERLTAAAGMDRAFFCNSGAESCETALKIARKARPGRPRVVAFDGSFHGRTLGALSVTGQERYRAPFRPLVPRVAFAPYGDVAAAVEAIDERCAAMVVEPIQGEGGVRPAPPGFLAALRRACDDAGALLVVDEVQSGIGRTGTFYACQREGVAPDVIMTAKALAAGLPIGAVLVRGDAAEALGPGDHGCTFGGGPFVAGVANAVLDVVLGDGFLDGVRRRGERLGAGLVELAARHRTVTEARGLGLMWGLALDGAQASDVAAALHESGMLTVPAGADVLRLVPPLTIGDGEIDDGLAMLDDALSGLDGGAG